LGPGGVPAGFGALLTSERGDVVQLTCNWNAPENFRLACSWSGGRYELRPFEVGRRFEGLDVIEPSADKPVRRYVPRVVEEIAVAPLFKPGFVEQTAALAALARGALP